jgi:hypothetical protein
MYVLCKNLQHTCWGIQEKICHPQNVGFDEIREISFQGRWIYEDLESWTCEAPKSQICEIWNLEPAKPWSCEPAKIWNLEPTKPWSCESAKIWILNLRGPEVTNLRRSGTGICEIRKCTEDQIRRLWRVEVFMNKRLANRLEAKSKTLPQKSGFGVWTSGRLVNVWDVKDIHVCVHTRNIP